jgi:hypothetical protein
VKGQGLVARKSALRYWTVKLDEDQLAKLHTEIRTGSEETASALFLRLVHITEDDARLEVRREIEFVRAVDASRAIGPEASARKITPRQALIAYALGYWHGEGPRPWQSPISRSALIHKADEYYLGPHEHLEVALRGLLAEGLFFEVHPGVFAEPAYFCSYDPEFLSEVPGAERFVAAWTDRQLYLDRHFKGWREAGLCWGQGRYGKRGEDLPEEDQGLCLGSSCCSLGPMAEYAQANLTHGTECTQGLGYDHRLLDLWRESFSHQRQDPQS